MYQKLLSYPVDSEVSNGYHPLFERLGTRMIIMLTMMMMMMEMIIMAIMMMMMRLSDFFLNEFVALGGIKPTFSFSELHLQHNVT